MSDSAIIIEIPSATGDGDLNANPMAVAVHAITAILSELPVPVMTRVVAAAAGFVIAEEIRLTGNDMVLALTGHTAMTRTAARQYLTLKGEQDVEGKKDTTHV